MGTKQKSSQKRGEILIIPRSTVIGNARTMMISVQRRTFGGAVFQATVKEEERIGMRGQEGDEDNLVEEARVLLQEELRASEEAGLLAPDLKVISFEARMTGGVNAANKGVLLQRWQLEGAPAQQVG